MQFTQTLMNTNAKVQAWYQRFDKHTKLILQLLLHNFFVVVVTQTIQNKILTLA